MVFARKPDPSRGPTDLDLRFRPVDPAQATTLTADQVEWFNERGFISGIDVFDAAEIDDLRHYFDDLLDTVMGAPDGRNSYSVNSYHAVCQRLWDLVVEPRIVALATDIVGDEAVCWGSHLFAKYPADPMEVPLHQDGVYWPLTPSRSVTIWIAVDDADVENGAMTFVPGSHRLGALEHDDLGLDGSRVLGRHVANADEFADRFLNELRAGQVSLHSDMLLHGSAINRSDRRRAGMTLRYVAAEVRLLEGFDFWKSSAVHVAKGDPEKFWANRRRPEGEHPELMADFWGEFDGQRPNAG